MYNVHPIYIQYIHIYLNRSIFKHHNFTREKYLNARIENCIDIWIAKYIIQIYPSPPRGIKDLLRNKYLLVFISG